MNVYVASSWKTASQPDVVRRLKDAGFDVYDFRNPEPGNHGFSWQEAGLPSGPMTAKEIVKTLEHPHAQNGFVLDMTALHAADLCVLLQPSGRSAHLEAGFCVGARKPTIVLLADGEPPDLMYKMCYALCTSVDEVVSRCEACRELRDGKR